MVLDKGIVASSLLSSIAVLGAESDGLMTVNALSLFVYLIKYLDLFKSEDNISLTLIQANLHPNCKTGV